MRTCTLLLRKAVSGVEESRLFSTMRAQILADLRDNTNDRSLAGRVDPKIVDLVEYINTSFPQYVTSSSCSGRVSLFHRGVPNKEGSSKHSSAAEEESEDDAPGSAALERRKRGAFGRGTLYQSHDPLPDDTRVAAQECLAPALEEFWAWRQTQPTAAELRMAEVLQLKFEPMILHVLCADFDAASELLKCASESGQMKSGIVSCSRGTKTHRKITCCITSPLSLEVPLFANDKWGFSPDDFRSEPWSLLLGVSVGYVNDLFNENVQRRARFEAELRHRARKAAAEEERRAHQRRQQQSKQPTATAKHEPEDGTDPAVNPP